MRQKKYKEIETFLENLGFKYYLKEDWWYSDRFGQDFWIFYDPDKYIATDDFMWIGDIINCQYLFNLLYERLLNKINETSRDFED